MARQVYFLKDPIDLVVNCSETYLTGIDLSIPESFLIRQCLSRQVTDVGGKQGGQVCNVATIAI